VPASYRHPFWCGNLRLTVFIPAVTTITFRPIVGATAITIILYPIGCNIVVDGRDNWGRGLHSGRWRNIGVGGILLTHLLFFFIRATKDDDVSIIGWPKKTVVEVTEELLGKLLILRGVTEEIFLVRR
jgi:hypothetical protein